MLLRASHTLARSSGRRFTVAQPAFHANRLALVRTAQRVAFSTASKDDGPNGRVGEGSHSDFQKQNKASVDNANETAEIFDVQQWLGTVVKEYPVLLFMKGSPQSPKCGFSASVVNILNDAGCEFASADILENEDVRSGLKTFSQWPTFPQLYIGGEFIGGADIVNELNKTGGLKPMLDKVGAIKSSK